MIIRSTRIRDKQSSVEMHLQPAGDVILIQVAWQDIRDLILSTHRQSLRRPVNMPTGANSREDDNGGR